MTNKISVQIKKRGFTLMETLIAVLVLSLAITGPLTIAQKGLQAGLISKDQDAAFYLAQDAVEYVRFARDTNCLVAGPGNGGCPAGNWLAGNGTAQTVNLTPCVSANGTAACTIDVVTGTQPQSCVSGICSPINYDSSRNYYTYGVTGGSVAPSIFTRTVSITSPVCNVGNTLCNANEAAVSVKVSWSDPLPHSVTVKENMLDWQ